MSGSSKPFFPSFFHALTRLEPVRRRPSPRGLEASFGKPLFGADYWPNTTACMIRPGMKVKTPAMTSAPKKIEIIVIL